MGKSQKTAIPGGLPAIPQSMQSGARVNLAQLLDFKQLRAWAKDIKGQPGRIAEAHGLGQ